ncbi:MAG: rhodanese-like domain-containing protein [Bacteroidota bacterium]
MTLNKVLASIALILALLAAFIGIPTREDRHLKEIAMLIETEGDHVTPLELAEQIYAGRSIRLIDLRDSLSHVRQHIVDSKMMSVEELLNHGIERNEMVVLYSEGGIHASQAWILLKMERYDSVYTLLGGFQGWKEEVLYPTLNAGITEAERQDVERRKMLSLFFGGEPSLISQEGSKRESARRNNSPPKQKPPVKVKKEEELRYRC